MPIYEYSCKKCGKTIEVIQKFSDPVLKKHQGCGGSLTKLVSAAGFQFKGTGWYVTDYARKGTNSDAEPSKEKKESTPKTDAAPKPASAKTSDSGKSSGKPSDS